MRNPLKTGLCFCEIIDSFVSICYVKCYLFSFCFPTDHVQDNFYLAVLNDSDKIRRRRYLFEVEENRFLFDEIPFGKEKSTRFCCVHKCVRGKKIVKVQIFGLTAEHVHFSAKNKQEIQTNFRKKKGAIIWKGYVIS